MNVGLKTFEEHGRGSLNHFEETVTRSPDFRQSTNSAILSKIVFKEANYTID